jgi:hypothetical protein
MSCFGDIFPYILTSTNSCTVFITLLAFCGFVKFFPIITQFIRQMAWFLLKTAGILGKNIPINANYLHTFGAKTRKNSS